jgi:hypothetical protein
LDLQSGLNFGTLPALRACRLGQARRFLMDYRRTFAVDNRDAGHVYEYLEARIEALKRRIAELESEKSVRDSSEKHETGSLDLTGADANRESSLFSQRRVG